MFRIAVCDDDPEGRLAADALLAEYFAAHPARAARRSLFPSGEALLRAIEEGQKFHLFLLDILMPGLGGIATGLALRERGQRGEILYLTTSAEFGVESYQARATDYLLKPVDKGRLFRIWMPSWPAGTAAAPPISSSIAARVFTACPSGRSCMRSGWTGPCSIIATMAPG